VQTTLLSERGSNRTKLKMHQPPIARCYVLGKGRYTCHTKNDAHHPQVVARTVQSTLQAPLPTTQVVATPEQPTLQAQALHATCPPAAFAPAAGIVGPAPAQTASIAPTPRPLAASAPTPVIFTALLCSQLPPITQAPDKGYSVCKRCLFMKRRKASAC